MKSEKSRDGKKLLSKKWGTLFGGGKDSMEQYKVLLCKQIQYVVPKFERYRG